MTSRLTIRRPDDWHLHLRDGAMLTAVCPESARHFARAIIMPNLVPPVVRGTDAAAYRDRILAARPEGSTFTPLMTLYLTEDTDPDDVARAHADGIIHAVKLYPAGATTNSDAGVAELEALYDTLAVMEAVDLPLLVHGEVTDHDIDIFDREKVFIDRHLRPIAERFPQLRIVLEHITTADAVAFVRECGEHVAATITAHHLLLNRNDMLVGGIRPHYYCLPVLKRRSHQEALREAATGGDAKFFLGTDSAPHATHTKESPCGCAGVYTAHAAIELYAEVFDEMNALDRLEAFASHFGPDFYRLPRNSDTITLQREAWDVPATRALGDTSLTPLRAGETVAWRVVD